MSGTIRSPSLLIIVAALASAAGAFVPVPAAGGRASGLQQQQSAVRRRSSAVVLSESDDPEHDAKVAKALKAMVGFSNSYCKNTNTKYCADMSIPAVVIKGLAEHKVTLGAPLCPCRHVRAAGHRTARNTLGKKMAARASCAQRLQFPCVRADDAMSQTRTV